MVVLKIIDDDVMSHIANRNQIAGILDPQTVFHTPTVLSLVR